MTEEQDLRRELEEMKEELDALQLTLEIVGTMDLESGILNRTGVLDALERGQRWLARRGDIYGLAIVHFPDLHDEVRHGEEAVEFRTHVAATMAAAVRDVDSVGRIDAATFAAVLADLRPGAIEVVAGRLGELLERLVESNPAIGGAFRLGGVEVLAPHPSGAVLEAATELALRSVDGPTLAQLD